MFLWRNMKEEAGCSSLALLRESLLLLKGFVLTEEDFFLIRDVVQRRSYFSSEALSVIFRNFIHREGPAGTQC